MSSTLKADYKKKEGNQELLSRKTQEHDRASGRSISSMTWKALALLDVRRKLETENNVKRQAPLL